MTTIRIVSLWALCILGVCNAVAQDRSLHWDSLTVTARLDAQGMLHVVERHAIVFDGAWNGGERSFQVRPWQQLYLKGLSEIDPATQARIPWVNGNLNAVGRYERSGDLLRWRARLPNDPPFDQAAKTYEIAYSLSGVVIPEAGSYRLEHDLAFPNRSGAIFVFDAKLELDPIWQADGLQTRWHQERLLPGESVFVNASLRYLGAGRPRNAAAVSAVPSTTNAPWVRYALFAALAAFALAHANALFRRERTRGAFEPPLPPERIDDTWLEANVFNRPPEVVGAAWDLDTSATEVAALLARLEQQGALRSEVRTRGFGWLKRETLHMELLWERDRLVDHERKLITALFFGGSRTTDTDRIRKHYSKSGFRPASRIKDGIERQLPIVFAKRRAVPEWARFLTACLFAVAVVSFFNSIAQAADVAHFVFGASVVLLGVAVFGLVFGYLYRTNVLDLGGKLARALICVALICGVVAFVLFGGVVPLVPIGAVSVALCAAAFVNMIFNMMYTSENPESFALRRQLSMARSYFERELRSATPRLKDEWFPYLLAFGLGARIDRWFEAFGGERSSGRRALGAGGTMSSGSSQSASGSTWSGGGGAFGGAGASGSWASAVGSIASGVPSPSSGGGGGRSGGGGGGGGGSGRSSGGGGGGGW